MDKTFNLNENGHCLKNNKNKWLFLFFFDFIHIISALMMHAVFMGVLELFLLFFCFLLQKRHTFAIIVSAIKKIISGAFYVNKNYSCASR